MEYKMDNFYTHPKIATKCWKELESIIDIHDYDLFLEPSAGEGSFFDLLPEPKLGIDVKPLRSDIIKENFLLTDFSPDRDIITIGCPPFGKNSSSAVHFFNHAATFSRIIGMIFPRTFRKISYQNRLNLNFHKIYEYSIPSDSFIIHGKPASIPTVFQIWEHKEILRNKIKLTTEVPEFNFVSKEDADFAFRRVGINAGAISLDLDVALASHYFIKSNIPAEELIERLERIDWDIVSNNTLGLPSISKGEMVLLFKEGKEGNLIWLDDML